MSTLAPPTDLQAATVSGCAAEIPAQLLSDNVHLTNLGYTKLGDGIVGSLEKAFSKKMASECTVVGEKKSYFWRGFTSERGSIRGPLMGSGGRGARHGVGSSHGGGQGGGRGCGHPGPYPRKPPQGPHPYKRH